jgi:general stress protein 26
MAEITHRTARTDGWDRDDLAEIAGNIAEIDICMLVTRSDDGLRGRPMSNNRNVEYDGDSWFFAYRDGNHVADIAIDPAVALAYMHTERGIWISVEGMASVVADVERKRALWQDELETWFPEGPEDERVVLIKVTAERARLWNDGEERILEPGTASGQPQATDRT